MQKFGKLLILCLLIAASAVTGAETRAAGRMGGAMESAALFGCSFCSISGGMCSDNGLCADGVYSCKPEKGNMSCSCVPTVD